MTEKYEVATQQASFFASIEKLAANPKVDTEKIKQIMDMQEHILDRNAKQAFNASMVKAQGRIELVVAKEENKQTGSKYADLKAILIHAKPIYTAEGFSLMFYEGESTKESHKKVCVDIMHEQGHTEQRYGNFAIQTTGIAGKPMMTQIHGEGSAFMYGRRYLTCMIFNIPTGDDDDGNAAGSKTIEPITKEQTNEINKLKKDLGMDEIKYINELNKSYSKAATDRLDTKQAGMLIVRLKAKLEQQKKDAK